MVCSSEASLPKRKKIATAMATTPSGKTTNWKRIARGDSLGMSAEGLVISSAGARHYEIRQIPLELRRRFRHYDRVFVAHALAQAAGDALVLLDEGDLVV